MLPMAWDEGNAIDRAAAVESWLRSVAAGVPLSQAFSRETVLQHWPYTIQREGHPAFYGLVIALGHLVAPSTFDPLTRWRWGPMLLFAIAVGWAFRKMDKRFGSRAACAATAAIVLFPRMFAHAHFASFDGPLTACWLLAWCAFPHRSPEWIKWGGWGVFLGLTMSCKATGWVAPAAFAFVALTYERKLWGRYLFGVATALLVFVAVNPPIWFSPMDGIGRFLWMNSHRRDLGGLNISTMFFGRLYNLDYPLPWYNGLVWTAIALPAGTLVCFGWAVAQWGTWAFGRLRRYAERATESGRDLPGLVKNELIAVLVANWGILVVIRAIPGVPPHDGIRLFLPSFIFAALLAGVGFDAIWSTAGRFRQRRLFRLGMVAMLAGGMVPMIVYAPSWLSHYNLLIGGLPGATRCGMEPTYYWDSLDDRTFEWLDAHTPTDATVGFAAAPPDNLRLLRNWGRFNFEPVLGMRDDTQWYVVQHRPSAWSRLDRVLFFQGRAAWEKRLGATGAKALGLDEVPLIRVFSRGECERIWRLAGDSVPERRD